MTETADFCVKFSNPTFAIPDISFVLFQKKTDARARAFIVLPRERDLSVN